MIQLETIEGVVNGRVSFHYDVSGDVLYLCLVDKLQTPALGEENDEGIIERRDEETDELIGYTIVGWWERYGIGPLPLSLPDLYEHVEPAAARLAA